MLHVFFGHHQKFDRQVISNVSGWFDVNYETEWLNTDWAKRVIRQIDKSEHIKDNYIESPVLGAIPPTLLSSGAKALILLAFDADADGNSIVVNGDRLGDNCWELLSELAQNKELHITLSHIPTAPANLCAEFVNNGVFAANGKEFARACAELYGQPHWFIS